MREWLVETWKRIAELSRQKNIRRIFYVLIITLSLGFIGYAIHANWSDLKSQKWEIDYIYIVLSILLYPLGMIPTVAAWHKLLEALGVRLRFVKNLRIYSLSSLPRHIPGLVWYVSSRTLLYQEEGVSAALILTATVMEVFLLAVTGFLSATWLLLLGGTVFEQFSVLQIVIPVALILSVVLIFSTPVFNNLLSRLRKRWNLEQTISINRSSLLACMMWMFGAWLGGGLLLFLLVRGLVPLEWSYFPIMVGTWGMASAIGLTIGIGISGMGLREVTLGALLSLVIPPLTAVVAAIGFRLVVTVGEFLWVALFVLITRSVPRESRGTDR